MDAARVGILLIECYLLVVVLDVLLAWVQPDPSRWPRRLGHVLTEPVQRPLRVLLGRLPLRGWDVSAVVLVLLLGILRVWLVRA